ncbi:MAG: leishmanolysin-related zinc metalloendopeptidase [Thermoguttaceae bacterium]
MSQLKTSKKRTFGKAWERIWDSLTGNSRSSCQDRKPRRLVVDPLEARQLLSITAGGASDVLINQTAINSLYVQEAQDQLTGANSAALSGKSVAIDNNGDFVVVWSRNDGVYQYDASGKVVGVEKDPATGVAMTDYNVYARYFTSAVQRVTLADGTSSFSLQYSGTAVQQITFSSDTSPYSTSKPAIFGNFTLCFVDRSGNIYTGIAAGYDENADMSDNVQVIQSAINDMIASGATMLAGTVVVGVDADTYQIYYGNASAGQFGNSTTTDPQASMVVASTSFTSGYLPAVNVTTIREPGTTITIQVSNDPTLTAAQNMAQTASNIEYAFANTSEDVSTAPIVFAPDGSIKPGVSPAGPYYTTETTRVALPGVTVTARSETEFDITFTGDLGKLEQPLLNVVNSTVVGGVTVDYEISGAKVQIIKQSSDEFRVNAAEPDNLNTNRVDVYDQKNAQVAIDSDGDFVITWVGTVPDSTTAGSVTDIFARRFSAAGYMTEVENVTLTIPTGITVLTGDFTLNVQKNGSLLTTSAIAFTFNNTTAATLEQSLSDTAENVRQALIGLGYDSETTSVTYTWDGSNNIVLRVSFGGADAGVSNHITGWTPSASLAAVIPQFATEADDTVSFFADMDHTFNDGSAETVVQGVRALGDAFRVNTVTTNAQSNASIGMDGDGNFTIAWQGVGQDLSYFNNIRAQRYDRDGNRLGDEFQVNTTDNTSINFNPYVAMSDDGVLAIGWDNTNDANYYLYGTIGVLVWAKVYDQNGAVLLQQFGAGSGDITGIDFDSADNFVIGCWVGTTSDNTNGGSNLLSADVFVEEWSITGAVLRSQFRASSATFTLTDSDFWPNNQLGGQPVIDADGDITVVYTGFGPDVSEYATVDYSAFSDSLSLAGNAGLSLYLNWSNYSTGISNSSGDVDSEIDGVLSVIQTSMNQGPTLALLLGSTGSGISATDKSFYAVMQSKWTGTHDIMIDGETMTGATVRALTDTERAIIDVIIRNSGYSRDKIIPPGCDVYCIENVTRSTTPTGHAAGATIIDPTTTLSSMEKNSMLGRIRAILESEIGLLRGAANDVLYSQFDSDPTSGNASCNVLSSDDVANNTRDGSNSRWLLTLDPNATSGTFTLRVTNSKNIYVDVVITPAFYPNGGPIDPDKTIKIIHDTLSALPTMGVNWPQKDFTHLFEGSLQVRLLSTAELTTRTGTNWDSTAYGIDGSSYVYEITFLGELHDSRVSISLAPDGNKLKLAKIRTPEIQQLVFDPSADGDSFTITFNGQTSGPIKFDTSNLAALEARVLTAFTTLGYPNLGVYSGTKVTVTQDGTTHNYVISITFDGLSDGVDWPDMVAVDVTDPTQIILFGEAQKGVTADKTTDAAAPNMACETYGTPGTSQYSASAAMSSDGSFVSVWNQASNGVTNLYFRTFTESNDTSGAKVTDFLLSGGDRLNSNETVNVGLKQIVVGFDQQLMTDGDNGVLNTDNWALMCDGVLISNAIDFVSFGLNEGYWEGLGTAASNKWEAVITFNTDAFANGLTNGHYQLVAKRTIFDVNGNPLASTGYNVNGADFSRSFDVLLPTGTETIVNDTVIDGSQVTTSQATASDADGDSIVAWATQSGQTLTFTFSSPPTSNSWFRLQVDSVKTNNIQFVSAGTALTASNIQAALSKLSVFGKQVPNLTVTYNSLKSNTTTYVFDLVYGPLSTVTVHPTITLTTPAGSMTRLPTGTTMNATPPATSGTVFATIYDVTWGTDASGNRVELSKTAHVVPITTNITASDVAVACDDAGNFVVTWSQIDTDGSGWNVHAALYNFDRTVRNGKSDFRVNSTPTNTQNNAAVAMDSDGDFTVTWQSYLQDGSGYGVYATRYDSNGNSTGGVNERNLLTFDVKFTGTFQLTWNGTTSTTRVRFDGSVDDSDDGTLLAQLRTALREIGLIAVENDPNQVVTISKVSGTQVRIEFINAKGNYDQLGITVDGVTPDSGSSGTVTATTEREGALPEFLVNDTTINDQSDPDIAMDDAGNFVITWTSYGQGGDNAYESNIYSKLFTASSGSDTGSQFNITVHFSGGLSTSQQLVFAEAAARWESIIVGDVADVMTGTGYIDDILIDASGVYIDGEGGILGQAGPTGVRTGSYLPYSGIMQFDTADLADMESEGSLLDVITHEMGHVLGFGTIWTDLNLLTGAGGDDPEFTGSGAVAEYNKAYGLTATSVPVENTGGDGTRDSHWRESVFGNELMTGWINSGTNVLSRMTAASMGDLGYEVNVNAAAVQMLSNLSDDDVQVGDLYGHLDVLQTSYTYADAVSALTGGGKETLVNSTVAGNQQWSSVAMDADGDFVITWTSYGQDGGSSSTTANGEDGVYARRYNANGTAASSEFCVNTFTEGDQQHSDVAMNAAGDFVVVWQSYQDKFGTTDTPNSYGIYGQQFVRNSLVSATTAYGNNGQYLEEFAINTTQDGDQLYPSIAMDDNGDFIVVWSGNGTQTTPKDNQGVFLQAFRQLKDTTGPRVIATIDTTTSTPNVLLDAETVTTAVATIKVTFTEMLNTEKAGQAGWAHSVWNPGNWSIAQGGASIAGGVTVNDCVFDDATNTYEVVLQFDIDPKTIVADPLDSGSYVLTLRANVWNAFGVALDGNDDGTAGGDFQRAFTINTGSGGGGGGGGGGDIPGPDTPDPTETDTPINTGSLLSGQEHVATASSSSGYIIVWEDSGVIYGQRYDATGKVVALLTANTIYGTHPDVAMNSDGDIVIVWEGYGSDGNYGIFARCYNSDGNVKGDPVRVSQISWAKQERPSVAVADNGNFIVTWTKYNVSGNLFGNIYGRTFRSNGTSLTNEYLVSTDTSRTNVNSDVAISSSGGVVVWEGYNASSNWDIYAQRLQLPATTELDTKAINFLGSQFLVNSYANNLQQDPSVAVDDSGNFVVSWSSYLQDGSLWGVYARQFYASGAARTSSEFRVNSVTSSYQWQSDVSCDSDGNFTVTWSSYGKDDVLLTDYGVYAHIYTAAGGEMKDSSGNVIGEFRVNATTAGNQTDPAVTMTDNGNVVLAWLGPVYYGTSVTAVYARLVGLTDADDSAKIIVGDSLILATSAGTVIRNSDGTLTTLHSWAATDVCTGDFDGDGYDDDVVIALHGYGTCLRLNYADSTSSWKLLTGLEAKNLVAGDVNGDGVDELTGDFGVDAKKFQWGLLQYTTANSKWVWLNKNSPTTVAIADIDSNGQDDLLVSFKGYGTFTQMNNGAWAYLHGTAASSITVADMDGDGRSNDIVVDFDSSGLWVRYNANNSSTAKWARLSTKNATAIAAADANSDGKDEVFADFGASSGICEYAVASGAWSKISSNVSNGTMTVADVNADGKKDVVVSLAASNGTSAWVGNASWTSVNAKSAASMSASRHLAALTFDGAAIADSAAASLTEAELNSIVAEAVRRLSAELGSYVTSTLASVHVKIANLDGATLAETDGTTIRIDDDAAGYGWFVDSTPSDDAEYAAVAGSTAMSALNGSAAADRVDLLTAVMHEMEHVLGYGHSSDLMNAKLGVGTRYSAENNASAVDKAYALLYYGENDN